MKNEISSKKEASYELDNGSLTEKDFALIDNLNPLKHFDLNSVDFPDSVFQKIENGACGIDMPSYEPDDGPLTPEQIEWIRANSSATNIPEESFTECLFTQIENGTYGKDEAWYEPDDGPLTNEQLAAISEANPLKDVSEDEVINRLF